MIKVSPKLRQYYKEYTRQGLPEELIKKFELAEEMITSGKCDDMPMLQFGQFVLEREREKNNV